MAKFFRGVGGSLVLRGSQHAGFRRKFFAALTCGGGTWRRHDGCGESVDAADCIIREFEEKRPAKADGRSSNSVKLFDLFRLPESLGPGVDVASEKKEEVLEELKCVVKALMSEDSAERRAAARKVRLLAKDDPEARKTLAMLGAIPPLVGMLDLEDNESLMASLYALLNLEIGNEENKAAIVKAGAVHKMLNLVESDLEPSFSEAVAVNFLGLSALDSNKPVIGSSGAIPFLVKNLQSFYRSKSQAKQDVLRALYNLSIFQPNLSIILKTNLVPFLLNALGDMEVSDQILSILSNVVATPEGRRAINRTPDSMPILVDVLNWTDSPGCQEKAAYVLMIMAHKGYGDRQAMIDAGLQSASLELTLLGSPLAQKRASRILECLKADKGTRVSANLRANLGVVVSAPIYGSSSSSYQNTGSGECSEELEGAMSEEKKAVKQLVQQSLQNNMRRIVKRANLPQDFVPSDNFKTLTASSTSKSLPF